MGHLNPNSEHTTNSLNTNDQQTIQLLFITSIHHLSTYATMSASIEYINVDPAVAADQFQQNFNLNRPDQAMSSYQKLMHEHTRQQFENATASSRRRSSGPMTSLQHDESRGSVSSSSS